MWRKPLLGSIFHSQQPH